MKTLNNKGEDSVTSNLLNFLETLTKTKLILFIVPEHLIKFILNFIVRYAYKYMIKQMSS